MGLLTFYGEIMYIIYKIKYYWDEADVVFIAYTTDKKLAKKLAKENDALYRFI